MTVVDKPLAATAPPAAEPLPAVHESSGEHGAHELSDPNRRVRLYIWQVPVRITHWVTAGAIVVLSVTGGYIADPFLIPSGGGR